MSRITREQVANSTRCMRCGQRRDEHVGRAMTCFSSMGDVFEPAQFVSDADASEPDDHPYRCDRCGKPMTLKRREDIDALVYRCPDGCDKMSVSEDVRVVRELLGNLEAYGWPVQLVEDGRAALSRIAAALEFGGNRKSGNRSK